MSIHIGAKPGDIASSILLPGDPLRARFIAENMLESAVCFNEVRGMLGFTGTYQGKRVSVMGTGMGMPSHGIYVHELITEYGVKELIRVGTCGCLQENIGMGDLILAMAASTNNHMNKLTFHGRDFAPCASYRLLQAAHAEGRKRGFPVHVGGILSADVFYEEEADWWRLWARYGTLAVEMEAAALYTLAARHGVDALAIMTVSDSLVTGAAATAEQRQTGFPRMAEVALEIVSGE
ncbi:purine-nucleoside phosphorylase [bacterium DOLZORAL124_64_63]|nr:MAG: purine-nucleoside phosphorylase [bacterium DOLZORAL124_64_63]